MNLRRELKKPKAENVKHEVKLGQLIAPDELQHRDAIHIACAPVFAGETLYPGQTVALVSKAMPHKVVGSKLNTIGIVDPFLKEPVYQDQRFWVFLFPNTITALRHEWEHPEFEFESAIGPQKEAEAELAIAKVKSEAWLREWADDFDMSYPELLIAAQRWIGSGDSYILGFTTPDRAYNESEMFWQHYEVVTGVKAEGERRENFFSCAC